MNVDTQGLTTHLLSMDTSGEGEPIVCVDDIKLLSTRHLTCNDRVVIDLLMQIAGITSSKLHRPEIVHVHIVKVSIDMLTQLEIIVGIHDVAHTLLHIIVIYITISNGHSIHGNDTAGMLALITKRMWQAEHCLNIALGFQAFRNTIIRSGESTKYMRRILPSKH